MKAHVLFLSILMSICSFAMAQNESVTVTSDDDYVWPVNTFEIDSACPKLFRNVDDTTNK